MSDAHQALSYSISADDRASAVFRGVQQELRQIQSLARSPLQGLNREWDSLAKRPPLQLVRAEQAVQIAKTEEAQRRLTREIERGGAATKLQAAELDLLARRHQNLQRELGRTTTAHAGLKKAGDVAAVGILGVTAAVVAGGVKQSLAWEALGHQIEQTTGMSGKHLDSLMGVISNLQGKVPYQLKDVADAAVQLRQRFGETNPVIEKTDAKMVAFAKRAEMEVAPAAKGLANVLRDFREPLSNVNSLMDEMVSISQLTQQPLGGMESTIERFGPKLQAMGFGLKESVRLMGILGESGVKSDQMGRGLATAIGAAQKAIGAGATGQSALEKQADAVRKAQERLQMLSLTIPKTRAEQERHNLSVHKAVEEVNEAEKKYRQLAEAVKQAGGAHATSGTLVRAWIGEIEHAKTPQDALSKAVEHFGRNIGPQFARAFYNNKQAIEATDHALHRHGTTQKLVEEEQKTFEGQVTELKESWHKAERELTSAFTPAIKGFLGVITAGLKPLGDFVEHNKSLAGIIGGGLAIGAAGYLARGPLGTVARGASHIPGLGWLSKIPGVGGGTGEISGILGSAKPGSRTNPIAVWSAGGGPNVPGTGPPGAPPVPEKPSEASRIPTQDLRTPTANTSEKGIVGKLLNADRPLATAGVVASALSGFAAAGAPGVKQDPADIAKAFLHGADPTTFMAGVFNKVFGTHVPSITQALGIVPNKLGFDPMERPDLAVRYMLTGILPKSGTTPHTAAARSYAEDPSKRGPGHAEATVAGTAPVFNAHELAQVSAEYSKSSRALVEANAEVKQSQEAVNSLVEEGKKDTPAYRHEVKALAEAEDDRRRALEGLLHASDKGSYLTPSQAKQLADFRAGLSIRKQAELFSQDRSGIERNIGTLEARLRAHPSSGTIRQVGQNYEKIISGIQTQMAAGLISVQRGTKEINKTLEEEGKALGVTIHANAQTNFGNSPAPKGPGAAFGPGPEGARGVRVPGPVGGDNWTLIDPSGRPAAKVAGAEILVANRHTEARVNQMLAPYGTSLGREVAGEQVAHSAPGRAKGGYVFPFPKGETFNWNRIDQGQDLQGPPGGPVLAIGPGSVSVGHDAFSGFGPFYPVETLSAGPWMGRSIYYGHVKDTRTGPVKAGDLIGITQSRANDWTAAPAGWLELGFTSALGHGIAGQGAAVAPMLHALAAGHMVAGGSAATIAPPAWKGPGGLVGAIGRAALRKVAAAANRKLAAAGGAGTATGKLVAGIMSIEHQAANIAGLGWNANVVHELLTKESGGGINEPPSGPLSATGPNQVIPSTFRSYALPGHGNINNPLDNAIASMRYIKSRYGSLAAMASTTGLFGSGYHGYAMGGRIPDFAGSFAQGGTVTADKPTLAMFGEGGRETAVFLPHAQTGARIASTHVSSTGLEETEGLNPENNQIEWHTSEEWKTIRLHHSQHAASLRAEKKAATEAAKALKKPEQELKKAGEELLRLTKAASPSDVVAAATHAVAGFLKLEREARHKHLKGLVAAFHKDAEWAYKWAGSTAMRLAQEAPAGQQAGVAKQSVGELQKLIRKAQAEGRRDVELGLLRDLQKTISTWHSAIAGTLSRRLDVAKAGADLRVAQQTLGELRSGGAGVKVKAGTARDAAFVKEQESANNKAIGEMQKEQGAISAAIKREQHLLGRLNAKLHRELKRHHKAAAHVIQTEINQIQAALGEARSEMEEVTGTIAQTETANLNLAAEQMKAAYESFKEQVDEATKAFEGERAAIGTRGEVEEGSLHRQGLDFSGLEESKAKQEGVLTPAQIQQAKADLASFEARKREEIASDERQRAYEQSILPSLSGEDRTNAERQIEELTRGINGLENAIYDQQKATAKLTEATNNAAKAFGGTVGIEFNGQNYVAGGSSTMSSVSGPDIGVGV